MGSSTCQIPGASARVSPSLQEQGRRLGFLCPEDHRTDNFKATILGAALLPHPHPSYPDGKEKAPGQGHKVILKPGMSCLAHRVPLTGELGSGWQEASSMSGLHEAGGGM